MKNKRNIQKLLKNTQCTNDMVEKVIAFAEGRLDENEYITIYEHLAKCDHCRYLLEEFGEIEEHKVENINVTPKISFKLENDTIYPITQEYIMHYNSAGVLSNNRNLDVVDYKITWFSNPTLIRAIAYNNTIILEIHTQSNDAVYYLINKQGQLKANVYNGVASFDNIEQGMYLISENKKYFCVIDIK